MKYAINGNTYTTTQDAYREGDHYQAQALDATGREYLIIWRMTDEWAAAEAALKADHSDTDALSIIQDEGNACNWDAPSEIIAL